MIRRVHIDPATGLLSGVRQVLSPFHDARPGAATLDLIIVHGISLPPGQYGGPWIDRLFTGTLPRDAHPYFQQIPPGSVSAHVLISRDGAPTQFVPFGRRAWHAGRSEYRGRSACNDFSIGIELEGSDEEPYANAQYEPLAQLVRELLRVYPTLDRERIIGHSDVAPGRKTDPGPGFDWERLRALLAA